MHSNYPCSLWYVLECCCYCTFFEVQFLVVAILVWTCLTVFFLGASSKYYIVTSCGYFRCRVDAPLAVVRPSQNPDLHFRWSDPNVVNLASIVHTLIGTARVSDYLHFFCKVYKYWNLHSGILWSSHKYLSPPIHHLIFLQGSTGFTAFLGNSYIFPFFCSKYPSLIT